MAYQSWSVVAGEQPTTSKWNTLGDNDAIFNDGTGIGDGAILARHRDQVVEATKVTMSNTGDENITGVGFKQSICVA